MRTGPIYHARTHLPEGTDPIPGLVLGSGVAIGDYYTAAMEIGDLRGYWRLGDADEPYLDTSEYDPGDPADLSVVAGTAPMTKDLTPGALPSSSDDGAVAWPTLTDKSFTGARIQGTTGQAEYLEWSGTDDRFRFEGNVPFSVACWVWLLPDDTETFDGGIISMVSPGATSMPGGSNSSGWRLYARWNPAYPSAAVWFTRGDAPGTITSYPVAQYAPIDQWFHVCGTYDGTSAIKLYFNGALVDSDVSTHVLDHNNNYVQIGYEAWQQADPILSHSKFNYLYGKVDEAAVWSKELTAEDVATLAALGNVEDNAPEGYVLTANGTGGTSWEAPTIEVDY